MFFSCDTLSFELSGVFKIGREATPPKASIDRNYDSISIRTKGSGDFTFKNSEITVGRSDVLYIPHNCNFIQKTDGETVYAVHFINYNGIKNNREELIKAQDTEFVEKTIKEMYDVWKERRQGYRYKCTALLYELIYCLNRQEHSIRADGQYIDSRIGRAIEHIHRNYRSEQIDIHALADMCNVSETYFRKSFKSVYGVSPKTYIIDLRLDFAAQLLLSRLYTVLEVSERSGFNDTKYFSRLFKRKFGVSPSRYSE